MNETVTALVPGEGIQAFATCNLRAAIWGGYDTALTVGSNSTTDRSAHAFSIVSGVFSEELALEDPGSGATYEGNGFVEIEDQETAFKLGLPFFITEVTFEGNSTIHYTVISNPDLSLEGAFATIEQRTDSTYSVTFDRRRAFRSETEPQQFSWTIDDSTAREESYLAIQTAIPGLNNFCLQSNHIKLEDLETSSTSQPSESGAGEIRITTSLGDVILTRAEIAAEDPFGSTAAPGYQIINVYFESADGTEIDGGDFYEESKGASLIGDDGSETNSYTGGLLSGELFVGFTPPASAKSFTLVWPGNDPVELDITR